MRHLTAPVCSFCIPLSVLCKARIREILRWKGGPARSVARPPSNLISHAGEAVPESAATLPTNHRNTNRESRCCLSAKRGTNRIAINPRAWISPRRSPTNQYKEGCTITSTVVRQHTDSHMSPLPSSHQSNPPHTLCPKNNTAWRRDKAQHTITRNGPTLPTS